MKTSSSLLQTSLLTVACSVALLLSACQTMPQQHPTSAFTCNKCQTVWVNSPDINGKPGSTYYALRSTKKMVCPGCESAIVSFLKTGQLKHQCTICGGTINHCTAH